MKKILVINASPNFQGSFSRRLSSTFVESVNNVVGSYQVSYRDLADGHMPHISQKWLEADNKPFSERSAEDIEALKTSDTLIAELHQTDIIVLATPMYNWSIPSSLKAYLDQVLRFNKTFTAGASKDGKRYLGLLKNKTLLLLFSRGSQGYGQGERNEHMDFQSGYLKMVFSIMGVEIIHELAIDGTRRNDPQLESELTAIEQKLCGLLQAEKGNVES